MTTCVIMSRYIFVALAAPIQEAAPRIARALGVTLTPVDESTCGAYWGEVEEGASVLVAHHDLVDGTVVNFDSYPLYVDVYAGEEPLTGRVARDVFDRLKELGIPMVLMHDIERKLAEFTPDATVQAASRPARSHADSTGRRARARQLSRT